MIMTKEDYFNRSREQGLNNRCPFLNRCERRFETIRLANKDVSLLEDLRPSEPKVPICGDFPYTAGGSNNFIIGGACPEVALFEPHLFFIGLNRAPTKKGQYDKYMNPQYEVLETGHFSECAEYSLAAADPNLAFQPLAQQEITSQILAKLDELLAEIKESRLDEGFKKKIEAAIAEARKSPSPGMLRRAAEVIDPLASIIGAGSKLAPLIEALGRLIGGI